MGLTSPVNSDTLLMMRNELGKSLKMLRLKKEMSLSQVSERLGIDKTYLSKIENGLRTPSSRVLNKLLDHYSATPQEKYSFHQLAGSPPIFPNNYELTHTNDILEEVSKLEESKQNDQQPGLNIKVPDNLPVLYTDSVWVTSSAFGLVFDFAQAVGPTNNHTVVSRVGMSIDHAKALMKVLSDKLVEAELKNKRSKKEGN